MVGTLNNVIPVFYRISIDPSALDNVGSGPITLYSSFSSDEQQQPGLINNLNRGFIENELVRDYYAQGFDFPSDYAISMVHERGGMRYEKILQNLSDNALPQYQLEFVKDYGFTPDPTAGPAQNPNEQEPTAGPFEFTVGYLREENVYTRNIEAAAGITSPATTEIFFEEEAINRQVARALITTYTIARLVHDPSQTTGQGPFGSTNFFRDLRNNIQLTAERLSTNLANAQSAVTVSKVALT